MLKGEVKAKLRLEPFMPLELRTVDGLRLDVPFQHVAVVMGDGLMVFRGIKDPHSRVATGYDFIAFDRIQSIGPRRARGGGPRKKAT